MEDLVAKCDALPEDASSIAMREIHNGMVSIHLPMTYELMNHTCSPITIGIAFDITTAIPDFPGQHPLTAGAQRPLHAARGVQLIGDPWVVDGQN